MRCCRRRRRRKQLLHGMRAPLVLMEMQCKRHWVVEWVNDGNGQQDGMGRASKEEDLRSQTVVFPLLAPCYSGIDFRSR